MDLFRRCHLTQCALFTFKVILIPVHSPYGPSLNRAGGREQRHPGLLLLGEKEHDVHKAKGTKKTESTVSEVFSNGTYMV